MTRGATTKRGVTLMTPDAIGVNHHHKHCLLPRVFVFVCVRVFASVHGPCLLPAV